MQSGTQAIPGTGGGVAAADALFGTAALAGVELGFARNAEIFGEDEDNDFVYQVVSGLVRTSKILCDGRRQIGAFHFPGDLFGLETGARHWCSAEAVSPCRILMVRRSALQRAAESDTRVAARLLAVTMNELQRSQAHGLLLVRSAQERVAAFLLEMAARTGRRQAIDLPMSRQDIADYLGLTIETVSRTITQLTEAAAIELVATRRIVLRDVPALAGLNA